MFYILPDDVDGSEKDESQGFEVMAENWRAYQFFCLAGTQWRIDTGCYLGLDYSAVESILRIHRVPHRQQAQLLREISLIESGALQQIAETRQINAAKPT